MHLIIDTEDTIAVSAAPADGEGSGPHHSDEGEGSHPQLMPLSCSRPGDEPTECVASAAATLKLLQEVLLPRLFPGVAPQLPLQGVVSRISAITTIMVLLQQSVITLQYNEGHVNDDSAEIPMGCTASQTPPSVIGVSPAAVCCQPPSLTPTASPPDDAACLPVSGGSWITVWLQLSAPLPSEGVTLLARYQGGFLDAHLESANDKGSALIIKVKV